MLTQPRLEVEVVVSSSRAASAPVVKETWPSACISRSAETYSMSSRAASASTASAGISTTRALKFS